MIILKNDKRYLGAPLDDYYLNLNIESTRSMYNSQVREFNISQADIFSSERNMCEKYFLHGKYEFLTEDNLTPYLEVGSICGYDIDYGIKIDEIKDGGIVINDISNFNIGDKIIYFDSLTKMEKITKVSHYQINDNRYILYLDLLNVKVGDIITASLISMDRYYKMISNNFKIFKSAFSINIFGDPIYQFVSNEDITLNKKELFNYPMTSLFYKNTRNNDDYVEGVNFNKILNASTYIHEEREVYYLTSNANRVDRVLLDLNELEITKIFDYIWLNGTLESNIFHEVKLRQFGELIEDNYSNIVNPPQYAVYFMDNEVFYKPIIDKSDVIIDSAYDFPFMNDLHYVYSDLKYIINDRALSIPEEENIVDELIDSYESEKLVNANKERLC